MPPSILPPSTAPPTTTSSSSSSHHPRAAYPSGVPSKFTPDGTLQPFPGNTITCCLPPTSPLHGPLTSLYNTFLTHPTLSHLYALLPPSSWHMTLLDCVCNQIRTPDDWPSDMPLSAPLSQCTALFTQKLRFFNLEPSEEPPYRMKITGFKPLTTGIAVRVEGKDAEEDVRIRGLRDRLAGLLCVKHQGHESYVLHFSLAYLLKWLSEEEERELRAVLDGWVGELEEKGREFELGAPEFCTFGDMFRFERVLCLGKEKEE